jgi:hypothetical protein
MSLERPGVALGTVPDGSRACTAAGGTPGVGAVGEVERGSGVETHALSSNIQMAL